MAYDITQFRANLQGDGARPNLFEVTLPFPAFANPGNAQTKLTFMARATQLPGSSIGRVSTYYFGRESKHAGNAVFADWNITVINDEDFAIRNAFERWKNGLNQHSLNRRNSSARSATSYGVDGSVKQFGKTGETLKTYKIIGAFPFDVSAINVDWGANDQIEEFNVTLAYQWWEDPVNGIL
jgi:hypothetical protein